MWFIGWGWERWPMSCKSIPCRLWEVMVIRGGFWWLKKGRCHKCVLEESQEGGYRELQASRSYLSVPGKVMENISRHTKDKRVFWNSQHGFTKGRSCLTHLVFLYDEMIGSADNGRTVDVDFRKTFDTVSYSILTAELVRYWLHKWTIRWVKIWLDLWVQRLVKSSTKSSWHSGQGTMVPLWAGQHSLVSLSMTWTIGQSAHSANSWMIPN